MMRDHEEFSCNYILINAFVIIIKFENLKKTQVLSKPFVLQRNITLS